MSVTTGTHQRIRTTLLTTPEGVPLRLEVAGIGDRAAALAIDALIGHGAVIVILMLVALVAMSSPVAFLGSTAPDGMFAIVILLMFFVRTPYFMFFELLWQGQTPGKRALRLQVVERNGGELSAGAIVARNLMREVEFFLPLSLLLSAMGGVASGWQTWVYLAWVSVLLVIPFLNPRRMRAGDMVGGTMVIHRPRPLLGNDLAEKTYGFRFSERHLEAYGAYELQVLEDVLRKSGRHDQAEIRADIAKRISRKIGYEERVAPDQVDDFLAAFYAAQRAHLERHQLFGERRADKHYASSGGGDRAQ